MKLKDGVKENGLDESLSKEEDPPIDENTWSNVSRRNNIQNKTQTQNKDISCTKCDFQGKNRLDVIKHVNNKHPNLNNKKQFNCYDCDFQGTTAVELMKHRNLKHSLNKEKEEWTIKCKVCGETFSKKWNIMRHKKDQHIHSIAPCRNEMDGGCSYSAEMCWWNHNIHQNSTNEKLNVLFVTKCFKVKQL